MRLKLKYDRQGLDIELRADAVTVFRTGEMPYLQDPVAKYSRRHGLNIFGRYAIISPLLLTPTLSELLRKDEAICKSLATG